VPGFKAICRSLTIIEDDVMWMEANTFRPTLEKFLRQNGF